MSLPVALRRAADAEFAAAAEWYEQQRPGLGADYVDAVQQALDLISSTPLLYSTVESDVREAPVRDFPYCVYYRVEPDRVVVLAVFHTSRDPAIWQARI
jgi:toxin ParE1/3/4